MEHVALKAGRAEPVEICPDVAVGDRRHRTSRRRRSLLPQRSQALTRRWLALNRGRLRALALGALSLLAFLVAWHLLTKYRVNIYVRFLNVPSPEQVLERAARAFTIRISSRMWC